MGRYIEKVYMQDAYLRCFILPNVRNLKKIQLYVNTSKNVYKPSLYKQAVGLS